MSEFENLKKLAGTDNVNHPPHYCRDNAMECIDEMILVFGTEAVKHFCLCNAWKYRYRAGNKNGEEDLKKSDWYLNKYKELSNNPNFSFGYGQARSGDSNYFTITPTMTPAPVPIYAMGNTTTVPCGQVIPAMNETTADTIQLNYRNV